MKNGYVTFYIYAACGLDREHRRDSKIISMLCIQIPNTTHTLTHSMLFEERITLTYSILARTGSNAAFHSSHHITLYGSLHPYALFGLAALDAHVILNSHTHSSHTHTHAKFISSLCVCFSVSVYTAEWNTHFFTR